MLDVPAARRINRTGMRRGEQGQPESDDVDTDTKEMEKTLIDEGAMGKA